MLDVCREKVIWQFVLLYFFDRLLENTVFLLDCFILSKSIRCLQCLAQRVFTQSELRTGRRHACRIGRLNHSKKCSRVNYAL